ncbi:Permease of the drug/metabolite transporter (DMT) superfamily protein [Minicystis rosea]|nr:Permease of the drug/metabolite transporter (DMT) superfamily protein [Minicystis rosea]
MQLREQRRARRRYNRPVKTPPHPIRVGAWLAVLAAVSFGVTAPLVKIVGAGAGAFGTAALLYLGAAGVSLFAPSSKAEEPPPQKRHLPRLLLVALIGAVIAPTLLAWGLQRASATTASLLLNLEAVFTVLLGWAFYREAIGRQVALAVLLITAGGALLVVGDRGLGGTSWLGPMAIAAASLGWSFDNTLTRPLSDLDPRKVVLMKAGLGTGLAAMASLLLEEARPTAAHALMLVGLGALGYGLSLRFYLLAQRRIGAGRTGSIFAIGPFVGVLVAWSIGERGMGATTVVAGLLFAIGIHLHVTEQHHHRHHHEPMDHEHAHRHDDAHHDHAHDPPFAGEHSHPHRHERREHAHDHGADLHHQHAHD